MTNAEITELLAKASPRPWIAGYGGQIRDVNDAMVFGNNADDMALIILAVNSYEALREALVEGRGAITLTRVMLADEDSYQLTDDRLAEALRMINAALEPRK